MWIVVENPQSSGLMHNQAVLPDPFFSTVASAAMCSDNRTIHTPQVLVELSDVYPRCVQSVQKFVPGALTIPTVGTTVVCFPGTEFAR